MRIWAKIITNQSIQKQTVREFDSLRSFSADALGAVVHEFCQELDLARPVLLKKHICDFSRFLRVSFKQADFMEEIDFDVFEIEVIKEKKKGS